MSIAANDRYVGAKQEHAVSGSPQQLLESSFIRLPALEPWDQRFATMQSVVRRFDPEWISLQYVPHGLQVRGMPFAFLRRIGQMRSDRSVHVLFHELWGGLENRFRDRVIYSIQKYLLIGIYRKLRPRVVNVTNQTYQERLKSIGITSEVLPLFSNIPLTPQRDLVNRDERKWVFVAFGTLRKGWDFERLLAQIDLAREASGIKECRFVSVGRLGDHGQLLWEAMKQSDYKHFIFEKLGELEEDDVSRVLHSADFGIAVSPLEIIAKSGAVAAMRDHGLPVVVTRFRPEVAASAASNQPGLILLDDRFQESLRAAKRLACRDSLPRVAEAFIESLKSAP
jgi:hypothetical protein